MVPRTLRVLDFGSQAIPYAQSLVLQEALYSARRESRVQDTLVLLQHRPVYTVGKRGKETDFKLPIEAIKQLGAEVFHVPRGGEVTYHGPGQMVAYPIIDIRAARLGARAFVEGLEDSIISTLGSHGIQSRGRLKGATGVWVEDRKIAAIGVKISHGISSHGLALNVHTDLSFFNLIIPCGIADKSVTSVAKELASRQGAGRQLMSENWEGQQQEQQEQHLQGLEQSDVANRHAAAGWSQQDVAQQEQQQMCVQGGGQKLYSSVTTAFIHAFQQKMGYDSIALQTAVPGVDMLQRYSSELQRGSLLHD